MRWDPIQGMFRNYEKGGGGAQTSVQQNYSPEEAAERAKIMQEASRIYGLNSNKASASDYPGAAPTALTPEQVQAQQMLKNYSTGGAANLAQSAGAANEFGLGAVLYPESNPALKAHIDSSNQAITRQFTDAGGMLSSIRSDFGGTDFGSSRRAIATGLAAGRTADAVAANTASITSDAYGKGLDTFSKALALTPQTMAAGTLPAQYLDTAGQQTYNQNAALEDFAAAGRGWGLNAPWMDLQNYANVIYGGSSPGTTTSSTGGAKANPLMGALGGAAMGASVGSAVPGIGTAVGAGVGALIGLLG